MDEPWFEGLLCISGVLATCASTKHFGGLPKGALAAVREGSRRGGI